MNLHHIVSIIPEDDFVDISKNFKNGSGYSIYFKKVETTCFYWIPIIYENNVDLALNFKGQILNIYRFLNFWKYFLLKWSTIL